MTTTISSFSLLPTTLLSSSTITKPTSSPIKLKTSHDDDYHHHSHNDIEEDDNAFDDNDNDNDDDEEQALMMERHHPRDSLVTLGNGIYLLSSSLSSTKSTISTTASTTASTSIQKKNQNKRPRNNNNNTTTTVVNNNNNNNNKTFQLILGAGGIYVSMLYVGSLQEDVFRFVAADGSMFDQAWYLQVLESVAFFVTGLLMVGWTGLTRRLPLTMFGWCGLAQVSAKACSNLSLAQGLPYPIMVLSKSCKMVPVMMGSLMFGGAHYSTREYVQVGMIIVGTILVMSSHYQQRATTATVVVVSVADETTSIENDEKDADTLLSPASLSSSSSSLPPSVATTASILAIVYILTSLILDGAVAGIQKRLQSDARQVGLKPTTTDFLFLTSIPMVFLSGVIAALNGDLVLGMEFCLEHPSLRGKIVRFCLCSAVGQVFVFYTLAQFDPLTVSFVTTSRKIFSVILSIFLKGHSLSQVGWAGVALACLGIVSELDAKRQAYQTTSRLQAINPKPPRTGAALERKLSALPSSLGY